MPKRTFPSPEALRRFPFGLADIAVILGTLILLALVGRIGAGTLVSFQPPDIVTGIDLGPRNLPYYAGRSTLRMFIVTRGVMGYGKRHYHKIHTARIIELSSDLPMVVTVIDTSEIRQRRSLPSCRWCKKWS